MLKIMSDTKDFSSFSLTPLKFMLFEFCFSCLYVYFSFHVQILSTQIKWELFGVLLTTSVCLWGEVFVRTDWMNVCLSATWPNYICRFFVQRLNILRWAHKSSWASHTIVERKAFDFLRLQCFSSGIALRYYSTVSCFPRCNAAKSLLPQTLLLIWFQVSIIWYSSLYRLILCILFFTFPVRIWSFPSFLLFAWNRIFHIYKLWFRIYLKGELSV